MLTSVVRPLAFVLFVVGAQQATANLRITDSQGAEVVVEGASIDYGSLFVGDKETQGIRVQQGDGSVLVKWTDVDTLIVTKRDDSVRPARVDLEIVLRNKKRVPATLRRAGKMQLVGRTELGEYTIDLDKVRRIVPIR